MKISKIKQYLKNNNQLLKIKYQLAVESKVLRVLETIII